MNQSIIPFIAESQKRKQEIQKEHRKQLEDLKYTLGARGVFLFVPTENKEVRA